VLRGVFIGEESMKIVTAPEKETLLERLITIHHQAYLVTLEYLESEDASMVVDLLGEIIDEMEGL
jgi:hypothetical protein